MWQKNSMKNLELNLKEFDLKMDEILETLKILRETLENSHAIPVWDKVLLDREKVMELIEKLDKSIPQEFYEAKKIIENKEKIINRAYMEAEEIIKQAQKEAETLVSNNKITLEAQKRAEEIINNARKEAEEIKKEMELYIENLLNKVEDLLKKEIELVKKCKSEL